MFHLMLWELDTVWEITSCAVNKSKYQPEKKEKNQNQIFHLPSSRYQLQINPWLGMELVLTRCLCVGILAEFVKVLSVLSQTLYVHIRLVVSGRYYFLGIFHHIWLLQSSWLPFHVDPWSLRVGVWWDYCLELSTPIAILSSHRPVASLCVVFPIYYKKKVLWWGLSNALIYEDSEWYVIKTILLLCSLKRRCISFISLASFGLFSWRNFGFCQTSFWT